MKSKLCIISLLFLSGCSLVISPSFPSDADSVDQGMVEPTNPEMGTDLSMPADQMLDADISIPVDIDMDMHVADDSVTPDGGVSDMMVELGRACTNWTECYSGEVCVDGYCGPSTAELCAGESPLETARAYDETNMCCLPEDEEVNGACTFPFRVNESAGGVYIVENWAQQSRQFSADSCSSDSPLPVQSDLVFEIPLESGAAGHRCVEINLASTEFGQMALSSPIPIEIEAFALNGCCEESLELTEDNCAQTKGAGPARWFNLEVSDVDKILFSVRLRHRALLETERLQLQSTTDVIDVVYSVGATPCCNTDDDCLPYAEEGEVLSCTGDNYCE